MMPADLPELPKTLETHFEKTPGINSLRDLPPVYASQTPYMWYRTSTGKSAVYKAPILPRQYLRQVVVSELGANHQWDWRIEPYMDNIVRFVDRIRTK